ncbi:hypothetical protein BCR39DRAFT_515474 [Naematelia encephala]|uniref:Uncharacterized protein n=1 Tax=Naematelia encephala TaxID=71784 RepID=A0A1Y2BJW4_9TREE|nr:hypothetical protein BCR39DRAFT_515474 [Naematelia encephala]
MGSHRHRADSRSPKRHRDSHDRHRERDRHHRKSKGERAEYSDEGESARKSRRKRRESRDDDHDEEDEGERRRRKRRNLTPEDDEDLLDLRKLGVAEITEDDYFKKSAEFKVWLKESRDKYLDEVSSESAHKYFRKFVRRWNDGALPKHIYLSSSIDPSSNTAYKWGFASSAGSQRHRSPSEDSQEPIGPTLSPPRHASSSRKRPLGPSLPSASDRQLAIEADVDARKAARKAELKDRYQKADEAVPRERGKEGKMDEKRATNASNKEMREKDVVGLEVDEGTLMGETDGFAAALRARDSAESRRADRRAAFMAERRVVEEERLSERKAKEAATMDMFKALAKQRFG